MIIGRPVIAIDTNIVVRALTADDAAQTERVRALLEQEQVFVSTTVLLETDWVLRRIYRVDPREVPKALEAFIALPQVRLEHPERAMHALRLVRQGFDFADAMHHAAALDAGCETFVTFDQKLAMLPKSERPTVRLL